MCECYNTMAKHFKAKKHFEIKMVSRHHCASPHFLCVLAKQVMRQCWVEGHEYCIIHVYICVQMFLGLDLSQRVRL